MNFSEENVIGIVGGMGPRAGNALVESITRNTHALADQQHLSVIMMSYPKYLPDRTEYLVGTATVNPAYNVARIIRKLEHAGANIIGIACNTSHAPGIFNVILQELHKTRSPVKLLNMPAETCRSIHEFESVRRVALLSTNGTWASGIYQEHLQMNGYDVIVPDAALQYNVIHKMIYDPRIGVKASTGEIPAETYELLQKACAWFKARGAEALVLGCTELSCMIAKKMIDDMVVIDSTEALARALIREAMHTSRNEAEEKAITLNLLQAK